MEALRADIRQSLRIMAKNPTFTVIAVAALALGIGANTAIFSVINKVLLEPLPYPQPERLVKLGRKYPDGEGSSNSIPKYMVWRHNNVFSSMTLYDQQGPGLNLTTGDHPEQVKGAHVSADYFKVFGVSPILGRTFTASEDAPNGPKSALISQSLWISRFGGNRKVLSQTITLNGDSYALIGILPGTFVASPPADVWIALQADPNSTNQGHYLSVAARLKPGVSIETARAQMKIVGEQFRRANPKSMDKNESVSVNSMRDSMVRDVKPALIILLGAVAFVLLIACANVANLLLARAAGRQKELAIRSAVGASRWRVIRQLLTESVMLSIAGGVAGFILGIWGVRTLLLLVPGNIPLLTDPGEAQHVLAIFDWPVALFTLGVSFLTGILFGIFPALQISRTDVASTLKEASGRSSTGRRHNWFRKTLVGIEMALALVLLTGAMLLIRTFVGLNAVDPGIDPHHVLTFQTSLVGDKYSSSAKTYTFTHESLRRIEALPGIEAAAVVVGLPTETEIDLPFNIAGKPPKAGEQANGDVQYRFASDHYFSAFKIPVLRGRVFTDRDAPNAAHVVVINKAMANKYWPKENPVGQVITIGQGIGPQFADLPRQVIGVVGDVRETGLSDTDVPVMYVPLGQVPDGLMQLANNVVPLAWCVRSPQDPNTLKAAVQQAIQSVDAQMPVARVRRMEQVIAEQLARQNFTMVLLSTFAGIALLLAAIGIYGLMSYSVEQQTQELGIRMALGADKPDLLRLIIGQGMLPALIGVGAGVAISFGLTRVLSRLLFAVSATDPLTFGTVAVGLTAVALLSIYVPARRAAKLDPLVALRQE